MILEEICETIVEHDGRGKVCREGETDLTDGLLNVEGRVIDLLDSPLGLGCAGRV